MTQGRNEEGWRMGGREQGDGGGGSEEAMMRGRVGEGVEEGNE